MARFRIAQFSLRFLLILVLAISLPLGWWVNSAERQRKAAEQFRLMGGTVDYDPRDESIAVPNWLRSVLPFDMYANVYAVDVPYHNRSPTNVDPHPFFPLLKAFPKIYSVCVGSPLVTDDDVAHLDGLTHLGYLHLQSKLVTDKSIETLIRFREINNLSLGCTGIKEDGFARLRAAYPPTSRVNSRNAVEQQAYEQAVEEYRRKVEEFKRTGVYK